MPKHDRLQDTINFALTAEDTVVSTTVKIVVSIAGMVTPELTEEALKSNVRRMMQGFVKDAPWNFSGVTRDAHPSGLEQIRLQASARVSEKENYALDRRCRALSQEGLSIVSATADLTPPMTLMEAAESKLRLTLLSKATAELEAVNKAMGASYRLGGVAFLSLGRDFDPKGLRAGASVSNFVQYASMSADDMGGDDLGNAMKISMTANVQLCKIVP